MPLSSPACNLATETRQRQEGLRRNAAILGDATQLPWRIHVASTDGVGHLSHIDIAVGIHGDAMRCYKLSGAFSFFRRAETADHLAFEIVDGNAMAQARCVVHTAHAVQFTHIDVILPQDHGIRPVNIVPHRDVGALWVKELDAVTFSVDHIDGVVTVHCDVVWTDKLPGVDAGTPPGALVLA